MFPSLPTINIPARLRFFLYLIAAAALMGVDYAVDKDWAGESEVSLVTKATGLLFILAAAKTTTTDTASVIEGKVVAQSGAESEFTAVLATTDDAAEIDEPLEFESDGESYTDLGGHEYPVPLTDSRAPGQPATPADGDPHRT